MAHQLENMAYVGQTPWHGLGNQLSPHQPIEVWAQQAGMDWQIESSNVSYIAENQHKQRIIMPHDEQRVLYRSDTHAALSVVSQRYQEVQPKEILEFYRDLTEQSGFELETAGVLKGGKKFWALARTGQSTALKGRDVSNGYILLATACVGTLATTAQFTSIRVVCNNTLLSRRYGPTGGWLLSYSYRNEPELEKSHELNSHTGYCEIEFDKELKLGKASYFNNSGIRTFGIINLQKVNE